MQSEHLTSIVSAFRLLRTSELHWTLALLVIAIISGIIQTIGLVSIMPFIAVVSDPQLVETNRYLMAIRAFFDVEGYRSLLVLFAGITLASLVLSNFFRVTNYILSLRFFNRLSSRLSTELLDKYLGRSIDRFHASSTGQLGKNVYSEVDRVLVGTLMASMEIISDLVTVLAILSLLIYVDARVALAAFATLSFSYYAIYSAFSKNIADLGEQFSKHETDIYSSVNQTLNLYREIQVANNKQHFVGLYGQPAKKRAEISTRYYALTIIPANILEIFAFATILAVSAYFALSASGTGSTTAMITIFAFAAYRLLPLLNSLSDQFKEILYGGSVLKKLLSDWTNPNPARKSDGLQDQINGLTEKISIQDISFSYPTSAKPLFENFSIEIPKGKMTCIRGRSGVGKTTLIDLLLGLRQPTEGSIYIDGKQLTLSNRRSWQSHVGYVPQKIHILAGTIAENIAFGVEPEDIDYEQVSRAASLACISDHIEQTFEEGYLAEIGDGGNLLSGGEAQRVGIARALYHDPDVLIFDEATNGLDPETENELLNRLLDDAGKTIVIVSHKTSVFERADELVHLR